MSALNVRVLIVDDEPDVCQYISALLHSAGVESEIALDGTAAIENIRSRRPGHFGLVLLDVSMPQQNGWEMLTALREAGDEVPVIFVSARDSTEDRVRGLRLGADDFVVKPFSFDELLARMEAVLRRRRSLAPLCIGELKLDMARRKTERCGKPVDLSPREFDLLLALSKSPGATLSRAQLLFDVWDMTFDPGTNLLDVHLGRLRKKLDRFGRPAIQTMRGEGYRLAVENLQS
ncbi:MAG: response regulator transcription factor [Planctomycetes bacterium]|nr:response regulator transcription factor [Planctomycetota bacterium]